MSQSPETADKGHALGQFLALHEEAFPKDHLRIGQRFCEMYILRSWPELYYEHNRLRAVSIISDWLDEHHYYTELPPVRKTL